MRDFRGYIEENILLGDGAMGTEFYRRGVARGHCYDELNISNPALVEEIHRDYISAGARLIETNTYGANRHILGKYYDLADSADEICERGAKIARSAVSWRDIFVAGSLGPITRPFETEESLSDDEISAVFSSQIKALIVGGVDVLILETFANLKEILIALKTAKSISSEIAVICSMSYVEGARTVTGVAPQESARRLIDAGADVIGANCGTGPRGVFEALRALAIDENMFISAIPNAGMPTFTDGRFEYESEPEYLAHYAKKYAGFGVRIIGGCCGTTPKHISAMSVALEGKSPQPVRKVAIVKEQPDIQQPSYKREPTNFEEKISNSFVYTMEIDPPRGTDAGDLIDAARRFKDLGGDAVNVSDIPMARLRMSALPLAAEIRRKAEIDVILHVTARDRNLIAIQSDLLGAHALGINNILALRGDPPSIGDYPFATGVYDITSEGIVSVISAFSHGVDRLGVEIDSPADFFVGTAVNQNSSRFERELARLDDKIAVGAGFIQTQPVFDIEKLKAVTDYVGGSAKVIASLMILRSSRHAEFLHNEVPGISIPKKIRSRFEKISGENARQEGIDIAMELLGQIRQVSDGVCFMPPFGKYEIVEKLLK